MQEGGALGEGQGVESEGKAVGEAEPPLPPPKPRPSPEVREVEEEEAEEDGPRAWPRGPLGWGWGCWWVSFPKALRRGGGKLGSGPKQSGAVRRRPDRRFVRKSAREKK